MKNFMIGVAVVFVFLVVLACCVPDCWFNGCG